MMMMMKRFKPSAFMSESVIKLCNSAMRFGYLVFPGLTFAGCFLRKKKKKANRWSLIWAVMSLEYLVEPSGAAVLPRNSQTPPPRDP